MPQNGLRNKVYSVLTAENTFKKKLLKNKSLEEIFMPLSDLKEEHFREDYWSVPFNLLVLGPLQGAAWLSTALP